MSEQPDLDKLLGDVLKIAQEAISYSGGPHRHRQNARGYAEVGAAVAKVRAALASRSDAGAAVPTEPRALWCSYCGEGTVPGLCRNKDQNAPYCHAAVPTVPAQAERNSAGETPTERQAFEAVVSVQSEPKAMKLDYWRAGIEYASRAAAVTTAPAVPPTILPAPPEQHIAYSDDFGALSAYRVGWMQGQQAYRAALSVVPTVPPNEAGQVYGIIDPEYGRAYTIIRRIAWMEGYAIALHGSFTRDLDLIAVPWADHACEPLHLVKRLAEAADLHYESNPSSKPHGRIAWLMHFAKFGDPRVVDLSIMPCAAVPTVPADEGPGTPTHRFGWLLDELQKRFPDPEPYSAKAYEGRLLKMLDAALSVAPTVPAPAEAWIVVKEHAWEHGDGKRPTLAYLWPSEFNRKVYASADEASAFIKGAKLPLGWVRMQLSAPPGVEPTAERKPHITLTGQQLKNALYWAIPDDDADYLEAEVCIGWSDGVKSDDEELAIEPGYVLWWSDYPEEGCVPLDGTSLAGAAAVPTEPNNDEVICPNCVHQFRAIPVNVQSMLRAAGHEPPYLAAVPTEPFQQRVQPWMLECFGPEISADKEERNHRFLEESLELVQATGCTRSEAHQLVDYVFGRTVGEPSQEVGGVMVTLAALCLAQGLDMHTAGETELARIWTKADVIRAKQAAKPKHSPLPATVPTVPAPAEQNVAEFLLDTLTRFPETKLWQVGRQLRAALSAPPAVEPSRAHRFGDLLCRLIECEELGPFSDVMPANLLNEWQEATDEHIDSIAPSKPDTKGAP